jgi:hypothetical protein
LLTDPALSAAVSDRQYAASRILTRQSVFYREIKFNWLSAATSVFDLKYTDTQGCSTAIKLQNLNF